MIIRIVKIVRGDVEWADTIGAAYNEETTRNSLWLARQLLKFLAIGYKEGTGNYLLGGDSQYDTWKKIGDTEFHIQKVRTSESGVEVLQDYART